MLRLYFIGEDSFFLISYMIFYMFPSCLYFKELEGKKEKPQNL